VRNLLPLVALAAWAQAQPPHNIDELRALVRQVTNRALNYNDSLPDFICTQSTRRSADFSGTGEHWEQIDTIEQQLTYFDHREHYKLLTVNGKRPAFGKSLKPGVTSTGEFGSMLNQLFDPSVGASFRWERMETLRGRPVDILSYQVEAARSRANVGVPGMVITTGYHGLVYADRDTKLVVRLVLDADPPQSFPMRDISHVLDYGLVPVAGAEYTLPLHGEMRARLPESLMHKRGKHSASGEVLTRNEVDFLKYRKYGADAVIKFEPDLTQRR
jgi:hypothetical protein